MNFFCGMIDLRKGFSLISSWVTWQRSSQSRTFHTPWAEFEPRHNLSLGFLEWSCAVMITTTVRHHNLINDFALKMKHSFPSKSATCDLFEIIDQRWILHYFAECQVIFFAMVIHPVDRDLILKKIWLKEELLAKDNHISEWVWTFEWLEVKNLYYHVYHCVPNEKQQQKTKQKNKQKKQAKY